MGALSTAAAACMIFFSGHTDSTGWELFRTDGTRRGTELVQDIAPGKKNSYISNLTAFQGKLLFAANDGVHGNELWISDGTNTGTRLVKDLEPGKKASWPHRLPETRAFSQMGDRIVFSTVIGEKWSDLWVSDGTTGGTRKVERFVIDNGSQAARVVIANDRVAILSGKKDGWRGLWALDARTLKLRKLLKLPDRGWSRTPIQAVPLGRDRFVIGLGNTWFRAEMDRLVVTDGTAEGTHVRDLRGRQVGSLYGSVDRSYVLLWGDMETYEGAIYRWSGEGPIEDVLAKGLVTVRSDGPSVQFSELDGVHYFLSSMRDRKAGIWRTDGTAAGTKLLQPIDKLGNGTSAFPREVLATNERIFVLANRAKSTSQYGIYELFGITPSGKVDRVRSGHYNSWAGMAFINGRLMVMRNYFNEERRLEDLFAIDPSSGESVMILPRGVMGGGYLTAVATKAGADCTSN